MCFVITNVYICLNRIETWFFSSYINGSAFQWVKSITIESVYWLSTNTEIMQFVFNSESYTVDLKIYSEQTDTILINTLTNKSYIALWSV